MPLWLLIIIFWIITDTLFHKLLIFQPRILTTFSSNAPDINMKKCLSVYCCWEHDCTLPFSEWEHTIAWSPFQLMVLCTCISSSLLWYCILLVLVKGHLKTQESKGQLYSDPQSFRCTLCRCVHVCSVWRPEEDICLICLRKGLPKNMALVIFTVHTMLGFQT